MRTVPKFPKVDHENRPQISYGWKNTIGNWLNKSVPSGPMSKTSQKIVWVESIKIR